MNSPSARIIIVCEDTQHQVFARRVLTKLGVPKHDLHIVDAPRGMSDAKQWIREEGLPAQWTAFRGYCMRNSWKRRVLLVVSDADDKTVEERAKDLVLRCTPTPSLEDHVCLVIPKWSVETWFKFLRAEPYNEAQKTVRVDKYGCAKECLPQADRLAQMCQEQSLPAHAPDSLKKACENFAKVKSELK